MDRGSVDRGRPAPEALLTDPASAGPAVPDPAVADPAVPDPGGMRPAVTRPAAPVLAQREAGALTPTPPGEEVPGPPSPEPPATEPCRPGVDLTWSEPPLLEAPAENVGAPVGAPIPPGVPVQHATSGEALASAAVGPARQGILGPLAVTVAGVSALAFGLYRLSADDRPAVTAALRADVLIAAIGFLAALVGAAIAAERLAKR